MTSATTIRRPPDIAVHQSLRGRLAAIAGGRHLVIGHIRSARCGVVVGDFTVSWRPIAPGPPFVPLDPIEGVEIHVERRLLEVMSLGGAELRSGGPFSRGALSVHLARPEQWVDFLDGWLGVRTPLEPSVPAPAPR